jgi:circadian clock protein KaiC
METHLAKLEQLVTEFRPSVVVLDAVSNLLNTGSATATKSMLIRAMDFLKHNRVTTVLTSLVPRRAEDEESSVDISSFIDTWLVLKNEATGCELKRTVQVVKSRGMSHSHQIVDFLITGDGLDLDVQAGGCSE